MVGVKTGGGVHGGGQVLVLEDVGQVQGANLQPRVQRPLFGKELQHECAEAAHGPLLHRDQGLVLTGQAQDQLHQVTLFHNAGTRSDYDLLQAKVDAFRTRKETIKATYSAAEAQTRINEAFTGMSGRHRAVLWLFAPTAVFTTVPYTESLFCAAAFWAWERARRGPGWGVGWARGGAAGSP